MHICVNDNNEHYKDFNRCLWTLIDDGTVHHHSSMLSCVLNILNTKLMSNYYDLNIETDIPEDKEVSLA